MKKSLLLAAFAALIIAEFNSCNKVANQLAQALTWQGVDVTLPVPPVSDTTNEQTVGMGSFTYNLDSFLKSKTGNLLGIKNIDTFRFSSCTLTITAGAGATTNNFQNFQMARASFYTSTNTTVTNLGQIDNNPDVPATTLSVPINNTSNLRSYIPNSGPIVIYYSCAGKMRRATTDTLTVNAHIDYYIHVTP